MVRRSKHKFAFSNRVLYTLIAVGILAIVGFGVYALGSVPNPGHAIADLQTCSNGEILETSGGAWTCVAMPAQSSSFPSGLSWGSTSNKLSTDQGGSIELGAGNNIANVNGNVPFIDFHYGNGNAEDYNVRLINDGDRILAIRSQTGPTEVSIEGDLSTSGIISGDGSGLTNLVVRITGTGSCSSSTDGMLRYQGSICSSSGYRSSTFDICMRQGSSTYAWYNLKTYSWADASCSAGGCPVGQSYYECTGVDVQPGCYSSQPAQCYCQYTDQTNCPL